MHESGRIWNSRRVCRRVRTVKRKMELEVRELLLELREVFEIECLDESACTIEEVDLASCLERLEELHDVAAERCHTGAAADEYVLDVVRVVLREEELSVRAADHHLVARLAREDIR